MYQDAIKMIRKAMELSGDRSKIAALGRVYALAGEKEEATKTIEELKELSRNRYISPYCFALIYASMNERDQAIEWLRIALEKRVSELIYMKVDPYLDNLRSDPRFDDLLSQVGLAP
jgi:tetratricopeptide (TPR) repeat protein